MPQSLSATLFVLALAALPARARQTSPRRTQNAVLFVTQVPVVSDYLTVASTFGNQDPSPRAVPRGGDLWIRYPNGELRNLTAAAGYGMPAGVQGARAIAVREPSVHWSGLKAVFSMVVGAPESPGAGGFLWQLYEIAGFAPNQTPVIRRVPGQPPLRNNVSPCYASDGRILFASDRPRDGSAHLYPQLDEYEEAPTNTGLWSLDPVSGELFLMNHAPSGVFKPIVDSFGRVVFTRWDHLERDQQADLDRMGLANHQVFNWSDESAMAVRTGSNDEVFPEPRPQWIDFVNSNPGYGGPLAGYEPHLGGITFNSFQLWTLNQDGTGEETLGHLGRHELFRSVPRSRRDDPNLTNQSSFPLWVSNPRPITAFHQVREDPRARGAYFGVDCREFDTHAAGQIVRLSAGPARSPNEMVVHYVTHPETQAPTLTPGPDHSGFYRNPLALSEGTLIAAHTANTRKDENQGTPSAPRSRFDFRLKFLELASNGYFEAGAPLTAGLHKRVVYYDPFRVVTHDGPLWELDPVELVARPAPPATAAPSLDTPEQRALDAENVQLGALRSYLAAEGLALIVSRNVTRRDRSDRQQPFNLRVPTGTETLGAGGRVYDVQYLRLFQADLIRGITNGVPTSAGGRRVLAQPLHDPRAENPSAPGAPPGSVLLGRDGSMAALVPARRALSWQLLDPAGAPVVNERYWVSFQPGEIRSCTGCHGANETDQAGQPPPTNTPLALRRLLRWLQARGEL